VNTKNISLVHLLAIYLKFNAPSFIFYSSTNFQKRVIGLQEKYWTKVPCKKKKERIKRKIYEPKYIIKFSKFKVKRKHFPNKGALELFCTPSPSTNILYSIIHI